MQKLLLALTSAVMTLSGCAEYSDWSPPVDLTRESNAQALPRDRVDCQALASQAANVVTEAAKGTAIGGATGAAAGASVGASVGDPGIAAAIGAAAGSIGGGVYKGVVADEDYKYIYSRCLKERGHAVIN